MHRSPMIHHQRSPPLYHHGASTPLWRMRHLACKPPLPPQPWPQSQGLRVTWSRSACPSDPHLCQSYYLAYRLWMTAFLCSHPHHTELWWPTECRGLLGSPSTPPPATHLSLSLRPGLIIHVAYLLFLSFCCFHHQLTVLHLIFLSWLIIEDICTV